MSLTPTRKPTLAYKKTRAEHHRRGKDYVKAYWPYLPLLGAGFVFLITFTDMAVTVSIGALVLVSLAIL